MDIVSLKTKLLQETIKDLVEINEAIAELEVLQHRSCDGRKYGKEEEEEIECEDTKYFCTHTDISFKYYPPYNFYCNRYEAKPLS